MQYVADRNNTRARLAAAAILAGAALLALLPGCRAKVPEVSGPEAGMTKSYERGPLTLDVHTSADTITTAETLTLTLSATLEDGYSVEFPAYPEPREPKTGEGDAAASPTEFSLVSDDDTPPVLQDDGRVTRSRAYHLEPFLEGAYAVPPLTVSFWKETEGEDQKSTFDTEAFSVTVTPVLPPDAAPSMKGIAGPLDVRDPFPWLRYSVLALLLLGAAGALYWYRFRYTPPPPPPAPPVPPHQRALDALDAIRRAKLVEQGRYKEYYIQVSDVLRRYMEEQFQVRAPERTTEEFLEDLQHNAVLGLQEQLLLREFLRHCDLVKFARAEPTSEQIGETMETCEKFIVDTEAASRAARQPAAAAGEA